MHPSLLLLSLAALPALAGAQRGVNVGGERAGDMGGRGAGGMSGGSRADRAVIATARPHMAALLRAIRENDAWSREETLKRLSPDQPPKAETLWKEDAERFGRMLPGAANGRPGPGV